MCGVFLMSFMLSGNLLFGNTNKDYKSVGESFMSLFRMLMGEFRYYTLEEANPVAAFLFFITFVVFFFIVLLNVLITIISETYDDLRQKKSLDTMAQAMIMKKDNIEYFQKWFNLLFCRMNSAISLEDDSDDDENSQDEEKLSLFQSGNQSARARRALQQERQNQKILRKRAKQKIHEEKSKDIKTICLHNKAKLFESGKIVKTKEQIENELNAIKKQIIRKKKQEREERIKRFQKVDHKAINKLKSSILYLVFLINFVVMVLLQLNIQNYGKAQKSLNQVVTNQKFISYQLYTPFSSDHLIFKKHPNKTEIYDLIPRQSLNDIYSRSQLYDWLDQCLIQIVYNNAKDVLLRSNHFFGSTRVRINVRRVQTHQNQNTYTNSSISFERNTDLLLPSDDVDNSELQSTFKGPYSKQLYNYYPPGNQSTFFKNGGYVINLPNNKTKAQNMIYNMILDGFFNEEFANMAIEFVTYNQNYQYFVITRIQFMMSNAGVVSPNLRFKVMRKSLYSNSLDYFRGFQEILYVIFVFYYLIVECRGFIQEWKIQVIIVSFLQVLIFSKDNKDKDFPYTTEEPDWLEKLCVFLEMDYKKTSSKGCCLLVLILFFKMIQWLLMQVIRFFRVLRRYLNTDFFKLFNVISIVFSFVLIGTWIKIIVDQDFKLDKNGDVYDSDYNQIEILSNLAFMYDIYIVYASINTIMIFFRILQFFSFSFNLSAFTEILAASKSDVFFFMLMFIILIFGYAVQGYSMFGQSNKNFSSIDNTILQLFMMLIEYFDYDSMVQWNPDYAIFFFVTFMILGDQFMKNMFIAIIVAHYNEFHQFSVVDRDAQEQEAERRDKLLYLLIFKTAKKTFCHKAIRAKANKTRNKALVWYVKKWESLEKWLFPPEIVEEQVITEEIKQLGEILTSKYQKPEYDKKRIHNFIRPFLVTEPREDFVNQNQNKSQELQDPEDLLTQREKKQKEEADQYKNRYQGDNDDNIVLIQNYISILPQNFEKVTIEEQTSSNVWLAALEKILFNQSQKKILYSDFYESEDQLKKYDTPVYDIDKFNDYQAQFLMKDNDDRIDLWTSATIEQKIQLWQVMDFEKVFNDENKYRETYAERLEDYMELLTQIEKELEKQEKIDEDWDDDVDEKVTHNNRSINSKQKSRKPSEVRKKQQQKIKQMQEEVKDKINNLPNVPVMTFKRIIKSPELSDPEFSKASEIQKNLWCNYTEAEDKFSLWFEKFSPYYQTKLWNKLCFSEDYLINIINTKKFYRQDLAIKVGQALKSIKDEFIENLDYQLSQVQNAHDMDKYSKKKIDKLKVQLDKIKKGEMKLEDAVKKAPFEIRNRHLTSEFFLQCLEIMKQRKQKVYAKLKLWAFKMKTLEKLYLMSEKVKEEQFEERLKFIRKKPQGSVSTDQNKTGKFVDFLGKKQQSNDIEDNIPSNMPSKLNITADHNFEKDGIGAQSIIGSHSRAPSLVPLFGTTGERSRENSLLPFKSLNNLEIKQRSITDITNQDPKIKRQNSNVFLRALKSTKMESEQMFELKKIPKNIYVETLKTYYSLMITGLSGDRLDNLANKKTQLQKYTYLVSTMESNEERLPLWLSMTEEEKLNMIAHQHIEGEAEVMIMLLLDETERMPSSTYKLAEFDRILERSLDNQIYEKYRRLTEFQALKATKQANDRRVQKLQEEDADILGMIKFVTDKHQQLTHSSKYLYKDIIKRYINNQHWRQQYEKKLAQQQSKKRKSLILDKPISLKIQDN